MNPVETAGLLVIAVIVMILLLFSFSRNELYISVQSFCILFFIFAVAVVVMVYNLDPRESIRWDLLVHYDTLEQMRTQGLDYVLHESEYKNLFLINWYFYLIALIGNDRLLSVFPVFIDFMCALYLIWDQLKMRYGDTAPLRDCAFISGIWFMSFGFMLSVSGVRCVLAMAIGVTALYLEYYKKEHRVLAVFLYAASLMTHSMGAAIFLIRILLYVKNKLVLQITLILACLLFSPAASIASGIIGNSYLRYLLTNVSKYWSFFGTLRWFIRESNSDRTIFICYLFICLFNLYMVSIIRKTYVVPLGEDAGEKHRDYRAWNLLSTVSILYVTGMFNFLFTQRITYILAYTFPLSIAMYLKAVDRNRSRMLLHLFILAICFWRFFFDDLYIFIVNYTGVYFLDL